MLSMEYLLEEAKTNGLPIVKQRAIVREYLQAIILNSVYKHPSGESMLFTGGTAMRFFYNMPRFSEDLDFDSPDITFDAFGDALKAATEGLAKEGFSPEVSADNRENIFSGELYFKDLMSMYKITDRRGMDLMIKMELYKPAWRIDRENSVMSLYGYNFSAGLLDKATVFAEKLLALFNRGRGRDIYDTLFMLKRHFPCNDKALEANGMTGPVKELITKRLKGFTKRELSSLAEQVRPFLFKEDDIELVLQAPLYAERFLSEY